MAELEARTARFTPGYKHSEEQEMADVDVVAQAVSAEATHHPSSFMPSPVLASPFFLSDLPELCDAPTGDCCPGED